MVEVGALLAIARATRADALVLFANLAVTVAFNLVTAVAVGIAVAVVLALRSGSRSATLDQVPLEDSVRSVAEHQLLAEHIVAYRIDGPLFFYLRCANRVFADTPTAIEHARELIRVSIPAIGSFATPRQDVGP
jgi:MFS superfamily sulfate permease-like transporter